MARKIKIDAHTSMCPSCQYSWNKEYYLKNCKGGTY